jgi:uncharacterized membrane protein YhdT
LPIFIASIIIYIIGIIIIYLLNKEKNEKKEFYERFNIGVIISDILLIVTSIIRARFAYTYFFTQYNLLYFLLTSVGIQIFYDVILADLYNLLPKNNSLFIDILKNKENKVIRLPIILTSILTNIGGILIASFLAVSNLNANITLLISLLNSLPYLIFLIK